MHDCEALHNLLKVVLEVVHECCVIDDATREGVAEFLGGKRKKVRVYGSNFGILVRRKNERKERIRDRPTFVLSIASLCRRKIASPLRLEGVGASCDCLPCDTCCERLSRSLSWKV